MSEVMTIIIALHMSNHRDFKMITRDLRYIEFVYSTGLKVCHNLRIERHKTFASIAKISRGIIYGFKLHIIVNHAGDSVAAKLTAANVDDRKPVPAFTAPEYEWIYAQFNRRACRLQPEIK